MSEQNKAVIRRLVDEVWNRRAFQVADELFAPEAIGQAGPCHQVAERYDSSVTPPAPSSIIAPSVSRNGGCGIRRGAGELFRKDKFTKAGWLYPEPGQL
jgi:hypothetical protein